MYRITLLDPMKQIIRTFLVDSVDHQDIIKAREEGYTETIQIFDVTTWQIVK